MFVYCMDVLHLSEAVAYLRITAARAARQHPVLLHMLADGLLHLTGIATLAPQLPPQNPDLLLSRAVHRSRRQIEELVAELASGLTFRVCSVSCRAGGLLRIEKRFPRIEKTPALPSYPFRTESCPLQMPLPHSVASASSPREDAGPPPVPAPPALFQPLAPSRYKVQFTARAQVRDKLERLRALLRSEVPDGDLASIIDKAVTR